MNNHNEDIDRRAREIRGLEEQRAAIGEQINDLYDAAKAAGYNPAKLREAVKITALPPDKRQKWDDGQTDLVLYIARLEGREAAE